MKRQALYHMYSIDDDEDDDDEMTDEESTRVVTTKHSLASATQDKCKCDLQNISILVIAFIL